MTVADETATEIGTSGTETTVGTVGTVGTVTTGIGTTATAATHSFQSQKSMALTSTASSKPKESLKCNLKDTHSCGLPTTII